GIDYRDEDRAGAVALELAAGAVSDGLGRWRCVPVTQQSGGLLGGGILGDVHAVDGGGACVPGAQERVAAAAGVASLQWPDAGTRDDLCAGVCPLEDARSSGQARGPGDGDPQARSPAGPGIAAASSDDARGNLAGVGQDRQRRRREGGDRGYEAGPPPSGAPDRRAETNPGGTGAGAT